MLEILSVPPQPVRFACRENQMVAYVDELFRPVKEGIDQFVFDHTNEKEVISAHLTQLLAEMKGLETINPSKSLKEAYILGRLNSYLLTLHYRYGTEVVANEDLSSHEKMQQIMPDLYSGLSLRP